MPVLIKNKSNRFISVSLQNSGADCLTFKDVNKLGRLDGYLRGVVYKVFPVFDHQIYGKLRKMILIEKNDDADIDNDDDDIPYPKLSFFTRGKVAERCSVIRKGDVLVLEQTFVERLHKDNPVYHLAGDKNLSDISVWVLKETRPSLIVKREKTQTQTAEELDDNESKDSTDSDREADSSDEESPSSDNIVQQSHQKRQNLKKSPENDNDFVPARVTRSATLPTSTSTASNDSKVTRNTKEHKSPLKTSVSHKEKSYIVKEHSQRITRSTVARKTTSSESSEFDTETTSTKETNKNRSPGKSFISHRMTRSTVAREKTASESSESDSEPTTSAKDTSKKQSPSKSCNSQRITRSTVAREKTASESSESDTEPTTSGKETSKQQSPSKSCNSQRITRSAVARKKTASESTSSSDMEVTVYLKDTSKKPSPNKSSRITRSRAREVTISTASFEQSNKYSTKPAMVLRSKDKSNENSSLSKRKYQSSLSEDEITEFPSSQEMSDEGPTVIKKGKRTLFGPKGTSSTPQKNPKIFNAVVQLENIKPKPSSVAVPHHVPRRSPRKQTQSSKATCPDIEMNQESNNSQPNTPIGLVQTNKQKLASKNNQATPSPSKNLRSLSAVSKAKNKVSSSAEASDKRHDTDKDNTKETCLAKRKSPRAGSKVQNQSSNRVCSDGDSEADSQTASQPTTPSGSFYTKTKKIKNKDDASDKQCQSNDTSTTQNAPSTSITQNALSTSNAQDAPGTSIPQSAPSTSTTQNAPSTSTTQNAPSTSTTQNAPSTSTTQNAPSTSTTQNAPSTSTTQNAPSTSTTQNAQGTSNTHNSPSTTTKNVPTTSAAVRDSYQVPSGYTKLSNLQLNTTASLYGVVKYFKPPWKSRGTDMCSVLVLVDPSTDEPLECVMFNKNAALLPQVRRIGDIVRLHRVNIKKYQDKFQGLSTRGFSCIVFDRDVSVPVSQDAARFSTATFTFDSSDKDMVKTLKEWRISQESLFEPAKVLTVSEVEPDMYFDIVCQVKGLSKQNNLDCVCLKATDGTDPKYEIKNCDDDEGFDTEVPFDPTVFQFNTFDVYLYGDHATLLLNMKVRDGCIIMLHNVHSSVVQGGLGASLLDVVEPTIELLVHRGSEYGRGLVVLSQDSADAQKLLQRLKTTS